MLKILTPNQKKFRKKLLVLSLLTAIVLPIVTTVLLNGSENIIYYKSSVYENVGGTVVAQIISIIGNMVSSGLFIASLVALGASVCCFSIKKTVPMILFTFLAPVINKITSFLTLYVLVLTGNHDYTLRNLYNEISVIFDVAVIDIFVNSLIIFACFIYFYFSNGIGENGVKNDKYFAGGMKLIFISISSFKLGSYIVDLIFTEYPSDMTLNVIMYTIVLPFVYIALEVVCCYFVIRYMVSYIDRTYSELGIYDEILKERENARIKKGRVKA